MPYHYYIRRPPSSPLTRPFVRQWQHPPINFCRAPSSADCGLLHSVILPMRNERAVRSIPQKWSTLSAVGAHELPENLFLRKFGFILVSPERKTVPLAIGATYDRSPGVLLRHFSPKRSIKPSPTYLANPRTFLFDYKKHPTLLSPSPNPSPLQSHLPPHRCL